VLEARCRWEKAVMLVRLLFNDQDRIEGYWIARDGEGPTPEGFREGGYLDGREMHRLAGRSTWLPVSLVQSDGNAPAGGAMRLRMALADGATTVPCPWVVPCFDDGMVSQWQDRPLKEGYPAVWADPETGRRWVDVQCVWFSTPGGKGPVDFMFDNLAPGEYRITVSRDRSEPGMADQYVDRQVHAASDVIRTDTSKRPRPVTVVLPAKLSTVASPDR